MLKEAYGMENVLAIQALKLCSYHIYQKSQYMKFPTMWYVRPAKPQISLHIGAVWLEPLLVAWLFYEC